MDGLDGMFLYLNNHQTDDTYSRIIIYLLNNRDKIALTNITDLANNCYVSISTISRFSKFFGYGSFQLMKESLKKDPSLDFKLRLNKDNYYNLDHAPEHFLSDFGNQIIASIQDTINTVDINAVDTLIQDIVRYDHVYLFGYDSTLDLLKRFQSAFLLNNKLLFMAFPDDLQLELSKKLDENSLCIVVSSYGTFFSKLPEVILNITNSKAKTVFLTQGTVNFFTSSFDHTISISSKPEPVTGNIAMEFFLDYVTKRSMKLLDSKL